ncbi:MAG: TPM domain-containing protein [Deltaproteobacteria bacterium]|nr:TPM domain-containing protein [Deltaproteobacteria bacterium]
MTGTSLIPASRPFRRRFSPHAACLFAATLLLAAVAVRAAEEQIPVPSGFVNDTAGIMGDWVEKTEALCRTIEQKTTAEVAVLTVRSTAPVPVEDYARMVFDKWKIGKKGKDNGVLIVVAVKDRKMWIATGYGVEGILPDGKVGEIRDRDMVPFFRQGDYGEGIYRGVSAVGSVLTGGEMRPIDRQARPQKRGSLSGILLLVILLALVGPWIFLGPLLGSRRRGGGGFFGGYGGGFGGGGFGGGGFGGFGGGGFGGGGAGGGW